LIAGLIRCRDRPTAIPHDAESAEQRDTTRRRAAAADPGVGAGSTDMGDVSQKLPSIHPYLAICARGETMCHEHAFATHAASDQGVAAMLDAARAMALTAQRFLGDADLRATVRAEFERGS
jgi:metal-dependent amidase/aminoacylase/carboxypeptidase family protein